MPMRERLRASLPVLAGASLLAFGATVCTTFSGLEAQDATPDAGADASDAGADVVPDAAPTRSYLSLEDAARACSLVFRCPSLAPSLVASMAIPVDDMNYSLCLHWLAGPISKQRVGFGLQSEALTCVAGAGTCDDAAACLFAEVMSPGDPRCADAGDGGEETCDDDGGTVLRCQYNYALHCNSAYYAPGSKCLEGINGWRGCGLEKGCTGGTSCVGSTLTYCATDSLKYGLNCAYMGYGCGIESDSGYPCIPEDGFTICSIPGASRCANDKVWVCDGLFESAFDCASLGFECTAVEGAPRCAPKAAACTPSDTDQNVCQGDSIDVCVGGDATTFDCASIGATCVPGSQGKTPHCG